MKFKDFLAQVDYEALKPEVLVRALNFKISNSILEYRDNRKSNLLNEKLEMLMDHMQKVPFIDIEKYYDMEENDAIDEIMDILEEQEKNYPGTTGY